MSIYRFYSIAHAAYAKGIPLIPPLIKGFMRIAFSATIPFTCEIGEGTVFPHGAQGVVIHDNAIIGTGCIIQANVVIGGRSGMEEVPIIGDNVMIGAGAAIIGPVTIGDNCSIGANAVVIHDVPDGCIAVGVPAVCKDARQ